MTKNSKLIIACLLTAAACAFADEKFNFDKLDLGKLPPVAEKKGLTYDNDIKPLLQASCVRCHGQQRPKANLRLDNREGILQGSKDGKVVVAGDSKHSPLVIAAAQIDDKTAMPPKRGPGGPGGNGPRPPGAPAPGDGNGNAPRPPGQGGPGGPGGFGPPAKPLTAQQVGLLRAWIDQGAK